MKKTLYPLVFKTIYKEKIWGGQKINTLLGKNYSPLSNCGETWEVSGVEENISVVADGAFEDKDLKWLIQQCKGDLVGEKNYRQFGDEFPLLIKFIDANDDLSIQVHPDDKLAKKRHNSFGKTEMWYVLQADNGASLIAGFNQELSKEDFINNFKNGRLIEILNKETANKGDVFFLPAGSIHTIGKGLFIAEIQQTSDITYRIYDFDRTDTIGKKRDLHIEQALDAIDYAKKDHYKSDYLDKENERVLLESCPYFETNKLTLTKDFNAEISKIDSFKIYICLEGEATLVSGASTIQLKRGIVVLVPACIEKYTINVVKSVELLETYIV